MDIKEAAVNASPSPSRAVPDAVLEGSKEAFLLSFSAAEDKAIMRKVDRKFLLLIGAIYLIKNIDYTNAASIKVLQVGQPSNILTELGMTADEYNWVQSIYFISYIVFEIPSNLLLKKMTPRNWQTRIILTWGGVLACHAAVHNKQGLYAARFFLGVMEAGMFPGLAAQLCSWYRSDEMGRPIMWMFGMQNLSGIIGSLLAYGISYMNGLGGLSAWRWVYLLEGLFTIFFAAIVYLVLPDYPKSPRSSRWLTTREQSYLEARLSANAPRTSDAAFAKGEVVAVLRDPRTYAFMLSQFLVNFAGYALQWQLPTITTGLGFAALPRNQLLNIPPAAGSVAAIAGAGWVLGHAYLTRSAFVMVIGAGMLVFFVLLATLTGKAAIYVACTLGTIFYSVWFIPFWAWRSATLTGTTGAAFGLAFQNCVGQVGGVIGPQLFQTRWAPSYKVPFAICAGAVGTAYGTTLWMWWLTRGLEADVRRVRRLRIKAEGAGEVFAGDDVRAFDDKR